MATSCFYRLFPCLVNKRIQVYPNNTIVDDGNQLLETQNERITLLEQKIQELEAANQLANVQIQQQTDDWAIKEENNCKEKQRLADLAKAVEIQRKLNEAFLKQKKNKITILRKKSKQLIQRGNSQNKIKIELNNQRKKNEASLQKIGEKHKQLEEENQRIETKRRQLEQDRIEVENQRKLNEASLEKIEEQRQQMEDEKKKIEEEQQKTSNNDSNEESDNNQIIEQDIDKEEFSTFKADIEQYLVNKKKAAFIKLYNDLTESKIPRFEDTKFPASDSSLGDDSQKFKEMIWKPASDIYKQLNVFQGDTKSDNVLQRTLKHENCDSLFFILNIFIQKGELGNCYFVSSMSSLASRDNLIKRLFATITVNDLKCFGIWICVDSQWNLIALDEFIPFKASTQLPAFSRSRLEELWVLLLEKCYAKVYGSYQHIESGTTCDAIKDLTGAPGKTIIIKDTNEESLWKDITENLQRKFILACGSQSKETGEKYENLGIQSGHAYSILDAKIVSEKLLDNSEKQTKLIKIRNPWGKDGYKVAWGYKDGRWTEELKQKLHYFPSEEDDGVFWMSINDFMIIFENISVNYVHENYYYSWYTLPNLQANAVFEFKVETESHCYVMFSQKDKRHFKIQQNSIYTYSQLKLFLFELNPITRIPIRYIGEDQTSKREVNLNIHFISIDILNIPLKKGYVEAQLDQGTYAIAVEANWKQDINKDVVFSIYSSSKVKKFSRITNELIVESLHCFLIQIDISKGKQDISRKYFIQQLCKAIEVKDFLKSKTVETETYKECKDLCKHTENIGGYIFFVYVNKSTNYILEERLTLKGENGILIKQDVFDFPAPNIVKIKVEPQQMKVLMCQKTREDVSLSWSQINEVYVKQSKEELIKKLLCLPDKGTQLRKGANLVNFFYKRHEYDLGYVLLYQNLTDRLIGEEELELTLTNLRVVNTDIDTTTNKLKFQVLPGQHYGVVLEKIDKYESAKIKSSSSFSFSSLAS